MQSDVGIIVMRELQEPPRCGIPVTVLTFGYGDILRLHYTRPEHQTEALSASEPTGSLSDLSDYERYAGGNEERSVLSDSEETSSMDQIAKLDEMEQLTGFDHFVHGASVLLGEAHL